jgi:putative restriction endonuclease
VSKDLNYYVRQIQKLRVNKVGGQAPYQPLLLLSLIELVEQDIVIDNCFSISPELISIFIKYRDRLSNGYYQADLAQPFYHMSKKDDAFWHLEPKPGHEEVLRSGGRLNTLKKLKENVLHGYFDIELFEILQNRTYCTTLIGTIIDQWFPGEFEKVKELLQIHSFEQLRLRLKESGGAIYSVEDVKDELVNEIRDAAFRKNLLILYDQRCTFCKLRIVSVFGENIIDGAHIKPFSKFRDDHYTNGLALCKNHHWAFDRGWFGIDQEYKVIVPFGRFAEEPPEASMSMHNFHGKRISLPIQEDAYPSQEALSWHREAWQIA